MDEKFMLYLGGYNISVINHMVNEADSVGRTTW